MPKTKQNIQIQGETLKKMDILRDAARKQGLLKSYPSVVADAVALFYDVSAKGGARLWQRRTRSRLSGRWCWEYLSPT